VIIYIKEYMIANLSTDKIRKNINSLLTELKALTGVSTEELEEFVKILELGGSDEKISS
tara:strand:+ start:122 stop:298 length:177 start_codon:yes stop_codon:yes gene_type:complete